MHKHYVNSVVLHFIYRQILEIRNKIRPSKKGSQALFFKVSINSSGAR